MSINGCGSLQNALFSGATNKVVPEVGMGVTIIMWTDREPGTIRKVSPSGKTFWYTRDNAKRTDNGGMSENQTWEFTTREDVPESSWIKVTLRRDGKYKEAGGTTVVRVGERDKYYDFTF